MLSAQAPHTTRAYLLPKLRYQFAEFLLLSSLKRLGIFIPSTCVGLRYGLVRLKLRGFSWDNFQSVQEPKFLSSHTLEFRARICLSAFYGAATGISNTPMTFRHPSPHRISRRCWNINQLPISYASLPRLRGRLTLRR